MVSRDNPRFVPCSPFIELRYPIVLDSVALSLGKGFVGTTRSTLSLLASKRVQDWEDGFVREVHLGTV